MSPDDAYAKLCETITEKVHSWDDLYRHFDGLASGVRERPGPVTLMDAFFNMYAFILAMRDLPEEGDAVVLAKRMAHNLTLGAEEVMGFKLQSLAAEEIAAARLQGLVGLLGALGAVAADAAPAEADPAQTEAPQGSQQKRTLH